MRQAIALVFAVSVLVGCGALFNSSTDPVQMNSNPGGASIFVDGNRVGATPLSVNLSTKDSHTVVFRMDGREDVTCIINRKVGVGWVVLDVLGGLVPVIIDAATGSWYELDTKVCNASFGGGLDLSSLDAGAQAQYRGLYSDLE